MLKRSLPFLPAHFFENHSSFSKTAFCKGTLFLFFTWTEFGDSTSCNQTPFGDRLQCLWDSCVSPWGRLLPSAPQRHPHSSPALCMQRYALMSKPSNAHFGWSGAETLSFSISMGLDCSCDGAWQETLEWSMCTAFQLQHGEKRHQLFAMCL